jgi:hypothetical protein
MQIDDSSLACGEATVIDCGFGAPVESAKSAIGGQLLQNAS